jgi:threonine aldolase
MTELIDLRSDTVTQPDREMRNAIASAPVGDDQFGEDPTINQLQDRVADLLQKEAALWLPTGTMSNQVALRVLTRPGDDVIVSRESHTVLHETGASGANSGIQFTPIGEKGIFRTEEFLAAVKPRGHIIYPPTTLVEIENTNNRAGGVIFPQPEAERICKQAKANDIATYLDGARLWNAAIASGLSPATLALPFDLVSVAFSKGLGAPGGSMLAGSKDLIHQCTRYRRMMGGAMRQVGIFAAACLYALDHNMQRLAEDHANARMLADRLSAHERILLYPKTVQTNILIFDVTEDAPDAQTIVNRAGEKGLLIFAFGPRTIRLVTHSDVSTVQCQKAAEILLKIVSDRN